MQGCCEEEEKEKRRRGKKEMTLGPIYKVKGEVIGARIEEHEYWIPNSSGRLDCQRLIN